MRRALSILCLSLCCWVGAATVTPLPVGAQEEPGTTTTLPPAPDIIPRPNQGVEPQDAGDRGGVLQATIFFLIVGGTLTIGFLAYRQSRTARAERGF